MKIWSALLLLALCSTAFAQTPSPAPPATPSPAATPADPPLVDRQPVWRCELPGGVAEVAVRSIVSVSSHEYVVDAVSRVVEVNIDTLGHMALRFYYIEPQTPAAPTGAGQSAFDRARELAKDLSGRTGMDATLRRAAKNYPTTTHSHTIEYRLESEEQLQRILASASAAFRSGTGGNLKLP
ncbi:hypothetical protein BH20VER1_BH20VER1_11730 [soil metagenome]